MAGLIVLRVERRVQEREIREHALGRYPHSQLEQVVVGLARIVVDTLLDLENMDRENRGLAIAQAGFGGLQQALHDQPPFRRDVGAVVERGKGHLRAGTGVHGVEVMDQGLHGLIGIAPGLLDRILAHKTQHLGCGACVHVTLQQTADRLVKPIVAGKAGDRAGLLLGVLDDGLAQQFAVLLIQIDLDGLGQIIGKSAAEGLFDAGRHGIVEIGDGLAAVLVVLVGLQCDAGQGRVRANVIWLAQEAMSGGEAALEQLD